ncbi:MAG: hypothetical protein OXH96_16395 [Spirochaetaceae bacterium]|nr:hypothetical protein [Spirochaetaceae bacterium]
MTTENKPVVTRKRLSDTLSQILAVWEPKFPYRLVGTAAALLQGVALPVRDIDILCREREAVDQFAAAMAGFPALQEPAWLAGDRQYYCNYDVAGVEVGASTVEVDVSHDTAETLGAGPWRHFREVPVGEHRVPAVRLELRLASEILRRRRDRSERLASFLRSHGCDTRLVARALSNAGVPRRTRERTLAALTAEH